jgi:hypothetical protein
VVSRFSIALALFGLLGLVAWLTLPDPKVRGVTLAVLAMFAVKSWLHHRRAALERTQSDAELGEAESKGMVGSGNRFGGPM